MKKIINQELNFFSTEGVIIASTDPNRIGQVNHEGAQFALDKNQPIVIEFDNQYEGAKQGINLPVDIDNQIVGVIGITGKKEEVAQYGEIIKEMTKVLILNNAARELVYNRRNVHRNIIDYIQNDDQSDAFSVEMLYGINLSSKNIQLLLVCQAMTVSRNNILRIFLMFIWIWSFSWEMKMPSLKLGEI